MQVLLPVLVLLLLSLPAHAQIYKCTSDKNSVVYSDNPCAAGDDQSLPGIVNQPIDEQPSLARKPPVILQLDTAVKSAIAVDDLTRAEALATTREQKCAQRRSGKPDRTCRMHSGQSQAGAGGRQAVS